jgi:hypothetical protein
MTLLNQEERYLKVFLLEYMLCLFTEFVLNVVCRLYNCTSFCIYK